MSSLLLSVHTDAYGKRMKMHAKACSWTGMLMSVYPYIRPNVMIMGISARWSRDSAARTSQPSPIVPFVCVCVCVLCCCCVEDSPRMGVLRTLGLSIPAVVCLHTAVLRMRDWGFESNRHGVGMLIRFPVCVRVLVCASVQERESVCVCVCVCVFLVNM